MSGDALMGIDDALAIASKIEEMADRVKNVDAAVPGAAAAWGFEMDGTRFRVVVSVDRERKQGKDAGA